VRESILPFIKPSDSSAPTGVHTSLQQLIRLQYKARGYSFLPRQPVHSVLAGRHSSRLRGRGLNFEEIRRYLPGDDVRNMDWMVTARTRKPHVRVYTEERDRPVMLLVDQRQGMFFGSRRAMKSVVAAEAAALAAWRTFFQGDRIGAVVFNDQEIVEVKAHRSRDQVLRILASVSCLNRSLSARPTSAANPGMYNHALRRASRLVSHDGLILSISDGTGVNDETMAVGTRIAAHNDALVCFVYDPLEASLPDGGRLIFGQAGEQLEVDTASASLRQAFKQRFQQRFDAVERFCRQRSVPRIALDTEAGVAEQVRAQLGYVART